MREHHCTAGCRCPNCDDTMAAAMRMPTDQYCRWLQATTAGMLAIAPKGPNIIPAEYRAMADYEPAPTDGQPARPSTPLSWIRAGVERMRREMRAEKAEREAERTRRKIRNQIAADYAYSVARPAPEPYSLALAERGLVPEVWKSDGTVPRPYDLALARRQGEKT